MMFFRGRRLRIKKEIRDLVKETTIAPSDLVQPFFVIESDDPFFEKPIPSMPGQKQYGIKALLEEIKKGISLGLSSVILFGIPKVKDDKASSAYDPDGIIQRAVKEIKDKFPELVVITDVCLCEYMSHGHCGIVKDGQILNDPTLELLAKTALSHAKAGSDMVAPSDMMDGRVKVIREVLDANGFENLPILSYSVKYASNFYGPFREAAQSAPSFGDRKSYQMDFRNKKEALREARADLDEGADIIMVKPAMPYLDIIHMLNQSLEAPVAAYQVSGEYAMIKAAGQNGWIDEKSVIFESLISIKRAGACFILTYFTLDVLRMLNSEGIV